jgi:hypothetical protein
MRQRRNDAIAVKLRRFADRYVVIADALSGDKKHFAAKRINDASAKIGVCYTRAGNRSA